MKVGDSTHALLPPHALVVSRSGAVREPTPEEVEEATSWGDKTLTISNRQLRDVLPQLKRWYGVDIKVPDLPLLDRPVTMKVSLDSPKEAITAVEQAAHVQFGYNDKTMVFHDAAAKPPGKAKKGGKK